MLSLACCRLPQYSGLTSLGRVMVVWAVGIKRILFGKDQKIEKERRGKDRGNYHGLHTRGDP